MATAVFSRCILHKKIEDRKEEAVKRLVSKSSQEEFM